MKDKTNVKFFKLHHRVEKGMGELQLLLFKKGNKRGLKNDL